MLYVGFASLLLAMGVWGTGISANDTYADVFAEFFELYNQGKEVAEISETVRVNNKELFDAPDDENNFWFALARAQWECKELQPVVFENVKAIIESGSDIAIWEGLGAAQSDINKRRKTLAGFLRLLESERPRVRKRKKKVIRQPIFAAGDCLTFKLKNGNFGGAIVLAAEFDTEQGSNLVAVTRINSDVRPTIADFKKAEILIRNWGAWEDTEAISWILKYRTNEVAALFEVVGSIEVVGEFLTQEEKYKYSFTSGWKMAVIDCANMQFESEKTKPEPTKKLSLSKFTRRSTWKFW